LAAALAGAPERLAAFRNSVRGTLKASPLMDGPGFAAKMEAASLYKPGYPTTRCFKQRY